MMYYPQSNQSKRRHSLPLQAPLFQSIEVYPAIQVCGFLGVLCALIPFKEFSISQMISVDIAGKICSSFTYDCSKETNAGQT